MKRHIECTADIGPDSIFECDVRSAPMPLDDTACVDLDDDIGPSGLWLLAIVAVIAISAAASALWPWGFALPLP